MKLKVASRPKWKEARPVPRICLVIVSLSVGHSYGASAPDPAVFTEERLKLVAMLTAAILLLYTLARGCYRLSVITPTERARRISSSLAYLAVGVLISMLVVPIYFFPNYVKVTSLAWIIPLVLISTMEGRSRLPSMFERMVRESPVGETIGLPMGFVPDPGRRVFQNPPPDDEPTTELPVPGKDLDRGHPDRSVGETPGDETRELPRGPVTQRVLNRSRGSIS